MLGLVLGLLFGILLGFLLKRSRYCIAGTIRDIYLEKRTKNIFYILSIIFVQSVIYFILAGTGAIAKTEYPDFSLVAIIVGSLIFGFGCILASGCVTISLVKVGDGRLSGLVSLLGFTLFTAVAKQGVLATTVGNIQQIAIMPDSFVNSLPFSPLFIAIPILVIVLFFLVKTNPPRKNVYQLPNQHTGLYNIFFEKTWNKAIASCLFGVIAGLSWYASGISGRNGGLGITGPVLSWFNYLANNAPGINWGSYFVLGVIIGSFICTKGSKEFSLVGSDGLNLTKSFLGGICMGVGSVLAQGCLLGNGLTGTATLSVKAWIALVFIVFGIWIGAFVFFKNRKGV